MDLSIENIKEISLVTDHVFYGYDENAYTDLLRISKGWISYKRTNFHTKKEVCNWSYKTNSEEYKDKYNRLVNKVIDVFKDDSRSIIRMTDCGSFNLRVTFKDDSHINLDILASYIREIIPNKEIHPDFIDEQFYRDNLTKTVLSEIDKERIVALMYAEGGAMGNPGEIEIVDEENIVYSNDSYYSGVDIPKEEMVTQFEVTDLFEGFEHVDGFASGFMRVVKLNNRPWLYLNLGAGNHLYVREDFFFRYGNEIFNVRKPEMYGNWGRLTNRKR